MMDNARCTNCTFLNFATASLCKRCGLPIDSVAGNEWNARADAYTETNSQPGSNFWDQPSYPTNYAPRPAPSSSLEAKIVKIIVVLAAVSLIAFIAIPRLLITKKTDFANLSWNEYRSPDGKFSASLPVAPKESVMSQMTPAGVIPVHIVEADVSKDGGCMVMYGDYPVEHMDISEETLYEQTLQGMARSSKLVGMGAHKYVTNGVYRGVEVELRPVAGNKMVAFGVCRLFWVSPRLYVVLAGGPDTAEFKAIRTRCLESFKLLKS